MTVLIIVYILFLLVISVYVGINVYHILRFRTKDENDKSALALTIYIVLLGVILLVTIIGAILAYYF